MDLLECPQKKLRLGKEYVDEDTEKNAFPDALPWAYRSKK